MSLAFTVYGVEAWRDILEVPLHGSWYLQDGRDEGLAGQLKSLALVWHFSGLRRWWLRSTSGHSEEYGGGGGNLSDLEHRWTLPLQSPSLLQCAQT